MEQCARCGRDVDEVRSISPDHITKELLDAIAHGEEEFANASDIDVCAECMDELKGD